MLTDYHMGVNEKEQMVLYLYFFGLQRTEDILWKGISWPQGIWFSLRVSFLQEKKREKRMEENNRQQVSSNDESDSVAWTRKEDLHKTEDV